MSQRPTMTSTRMSGSIQLRHSQVKCFVKAMQPRLSSSFQSRSRHATRIAALLDINEADFENEVFKSELPVLVDFWATWCGPCKLVAPSMVWVDKELGDKIKVVKINCTDDNKGLMEQFKVYGLPCLILFKDGAEIEGSHREGAITRKDLVKYLEKHVGIVAPV